MIRRGIPSLLLVAVLAGCGGSEGGGQVEPRAYAGAVCSSLLDWRGGVTADSTELSNSLKAGGADVATVRARYARFYAATVRRTDELLRAVERAGAPDVDNGLGYARDLATALGRTRTGLADARARFAALSTRDLRSYAAGAARIRDSLGALFAEVGRALDRLGTSYPDGSLDEAFRDEPACQRLG